MPPNSLDAAGCHGRIGMLLKYIYLAMVACGT